MRNVCSGFSSNIACVGALALAVQLASKAPRGDREGVREREKSAMNNRVNERDQLYYFPLCNAMATRQQATISRVEKNYCVGTTPDGTEYFVRTTSMRVRTEWSKLIVGDAIEFSIRYAAGRGIISDVVVVRRG